jgi:hypothetical protein
LNLALLLVGMFLLGKGYYDFNSALFGSTSFSLIINKDMNFEVGYYFFGMLYGAACQISNNSWLKLFAGCIGFMCTVFGGYVIYDSYQDAYFSGAECAIYNDELDNINECLESLK